MTFEKYIKPFGVPESEEMRHLIDIYLEHKSSGSSKTNLSQRNVQLFHPVFKLLTMNGFKYLIENSAFVILRKNQILYK